MKKIGFILLLVSVLLAACTRSEELASPTPLPDEIPWADAVSLLKTGEVAQVVQLHNLTVTLTLKDGQRVKTVEPVIDAIFDAVQRCGAPCANIILATE
jgi:hypothetical protein